jgi:hypothetical protein
MARQVTRIGVGPNGMIIKSSDAKVIDDHLAAKCRVGSRPAQRERDRPFLSARSRALEGGAEPQTIDRCDEVLHGGLCRVEHHLCPHVPAAHSRPAHALELFQGSLDRHRSGASGHAVHREDHRPRGCCRSVSHKESADEPSRRHCLAARAQPPRLCSEEEAPLRRRDLPASNPSRPARHPPRRCRA